MDLKKSGWILSESGLKSIESSGSSKNLIKTLLDRDLREVGAGISDLSKGKFESLDHELAVLQILKVRNVSAPKANEASKTAPKLLKLQLTDGVNAYSAIEMEPTPLQIETKPGTKIALKVKEMKMANGQLLFTPKNIEILGGYVEALVSKWEVTRSLAVMKGVNRTGATGGPPPFIPFGQKIQQNISTERGFKSLQPTKPEKTENDDSEFKAQRQDAIAEASKVGTKKVFGGGSKTLVDTNVQKVMDKGFTEEQATTALKYSRNNVEKALGNLKRREENQKRANSSEYEPREYSKEKRGQRGDTDEPVSSKPSGAVSLFDFLEKKIPAQDSTAKHSSFAHNERFENNISSSFRKHDKDIADGSHHWSGSEQKSSQNYKGSNNYNNPKGYRDDPRDQPRDYRNNRDSRDNRDHRDNYRDTRDNRDGDLRRDSKYQQQSNHYGSKPNTTASNQYQKPLGSANNGPSNTGYNNNSRDINKGKYQKPDYNATKPSGPPPKDYNSYPPAGNNSNFNSKPRGNGTSKYYNEQQSNDYQKPSRNVVDSMEKMSLKGNHQPQYKGGVDSKLSASNYPPLTPSTEQKSFSKPGYPIVGFQSKEANESAKNALKTKNIPGAPHPQPSHQPNHQSKPHVNNWQQKQQPQSAPQHQMPVQVISQQPMKNQPPPPFPQNVQGVPQTGPAPMHTLPQPFTVQHQPHPVIHAMPAQVITGSSAPPTAVFQPINYPTPIMMPPPGMGPPQAVSNPQQMMKIGDLCVAKYWEDGQFYNAKVTAVGESTYVVLFTEYGNAEEVRKNDCVPLIPACPTPPQPTSFVSAPQMGATYRIPAQKMPHHAYHQPPTSSMPYKSVPGNNHRRN